MSKRHVLIGFVIISFMAHFGMLAIGETSPKIKVHKAKVSVSPPDQQGLVTITGQPGAVETELKATGEITIIKSGGAFEITEQGAFLTQVSAESGDKIRVQAKNEAKKKSVGTFKVPAQQEISSQIESTTPVLTMMIVDAQTGKPLAKRQLKLPSSLTEPTKALTKPEAEKCLDQYLLYIQKELEVKTATEEKEKNVSP